MASLKVKLDLRFVHVVKEKSGRSWEWDSGCLINKVVGCSVAKAAHRSSRAPSFCWFLFFHFVPGQGRTQEFQDPFFLLAYVLVPCSRPGPHTGFPGPLPSAGFYFSTMFKARAAHRSSGAPSFCGLSCTPVCGSGQAIQQGCGCQLVIRSFGRSVIMVGDEG